MSNSQQFSRYLYNDDMRHKKTNFFKQLATDALGILMLLGAIAFGWIPGPGGIPLLLGGLGLLSINHEWAKKLLIKAKNGGNIFYETLFPDNKKLYLLYDILGLAIFCLGMYIISLETKNITQTLAIALALLAVGLLLTNRKRLETIATYIQKFKKRKH